MCAVKGLHPHCHFWLSATVGIISTPKRKCLFTLRSPLKPRFASVHFDERVYIKFRVEWYPKNQIYQMIVHKMWATATHYECYYCTPGEIRMYTSPHTTEDIFMKSSQKILWFVSLTCDFIVSEQGSESCNWSYVPVWRRREWGGVCGGVAACFFHL